MQLTGGADVSDRHGFATQKFALRQPFLHHSARFHVLALMERELLGREFLTQTRAEQGLEDLEPNALSQIGVVPVQVLVDDGTLSRLTREEIVEVPAVCQVTHDGMALC